MHPRIHIIILPCIRPERFKRIFIKRCLSNLNEITTYFLSSFLPSSPPLLLPPSLLPSLPSILPSFLIPSLFSSFLEGLNRGTSITLKNFIFCLCNMKQLTWPGYGLLRWLNFRHFNSNSKKFFETVNFFPERSKNGSKRANIIFLGISRSFRPFYDNSGLFQKISEGYRRFPKTIEDFRRLTKRFDHCRRCPKNPPNTK